VSFMSKFSGVLVPLIDASRPRESLLSNLDVLSRYLYYKVKCKNISNFLTIITLHFKYQSVEQLELFFKSNWLSNIFNIYFYMISIK